MNHFLCLVIVAVNCVMEFDQQLGYHVNEQEYPVVYPATNWAQKTPNVSNELTMMIDNMVRYDLAQTGAKSVKSPVSLQSQKNRKGGQLRLKSHQRFGGLRQRMFARYHQSFHN